MILGSADVFFKHPFGDAGVRNLPPKGFGFFVGENDVNIEG